MVSVLCHIPPITKVDDEFAKFWRHVIFWTACMRVLLKNMHALNNRRRSPARCQRISCPQKIS